MLNDLLSTVGLFVAAVVVLAAVVAVLVAAIGQAERWGKHTGPLVLLALLIALAVGWGLWERQGHPWRSVEEKCEGCAW